MLDSIRSCSVSLGSSFKSASVAAVTLVPAPAPTSHPSRVSRAPGPPPATCLFTPASRPFAVDDAEGDNIAGAPDGPPAGAGAAAAVAVAANDDDDVDPIVEGVIWAALAAVGVGAGVGSASGPPGENRFIHGDAMACSTVQRRRGSNLSRLYTNAFASLCTV